MDSFALRLALALAYPWLAHWASHGGGDTVALLALLDLVLVILVEGLVRRRPGAWAVLLVAIVSLTAMHGTVGLRLLLLAPPMLFTGLLAWLFARSLADPRGALISRIVAAMDRVEPAGLAPDLLRYTRRLTGAWAALLGLLCVVNGVLAMIAVPDGVLAQLGQTAAVSVTRAQWSLFANLLNYGLVGVFFIGEYALRRRWFPDRPYRNFIEFIQRMGRLGPQFWRSLFTRD